jgi:Beta-lactamase
MQTNLTLQPTSERGWRKGLANLWHKESHLWWGTWQWLIHVGIWAFLLNGLYGIVLLALIHTPAEARTPEPGLTFFGFGLFLFTILTLIFVANPAGQPVTPQTPFILGSSSKSFTALAIMQLVEAGRVRLDAPVQRYIPWFSVATSGASAAITVRHLLNQVSGIPTRAVAASSLAGTGDETLEQEVRALSSVALTAPVGTTFQYSNLNFATLGLIVQRVAGQAYGTYIQQHIFAPLEMQHSFVSQAEAMRWRL